MKKIILKLMVQFLYSFKEHCSPDTKYSEKNYKVAKAALAVNELLNFLKIK